jgi:aryl carrier-like protein
MAPSVYVRLDEFPLTANAKVDRRLLPEPDWNTRAVAGEYVAPRTRCERDLAAIWEDVLGVRPVGVTANFFELGGRSLAAVRVFAKISRRRGRDLPLSALFAAPTIEKLAASLESSSTVDETGYRTLIPIRTSGKRPPFFCVHGGAGSTLFLETLARRLKEDQPFYGIEPEGLDGRNFERRSIEQMATAYIDAIRTVEPHGPYQIGGYCFGGVVAVEMAQQLKQRGEAVSLVALFSAPLRFHRLMQPRTGSVRKSKLRKLAANPQRVIRGQWRTLMYRLRAAWDGGVPRLFLKLGMRVPPLLRTGYVDQTLRVAEMAYKPRYYDGRILLFRGRGIWDEQGKMGWDGLVRDVETRFIGETATQLRRDIMEEPLVTHLAAELSSCLSEAQVLRRETREPALATPRA